jgi:hypothetical protein
MKELEEGTCGFVLEADDPKYDCQICSANLEQQGQPPCEANAGDYEFVADSGERVFFAPRVSRSCLALSKGRREFEQVIPRGAIFGRRVGDPAKDELSISSGAQHVAAGSIAKI